MNVLAKHWSESLSKRGIELNLTSVFCHGFPRVSFEQNGKQSSVELADLLVVRRHFNRGKLEKETACLIQSKMSDDSTNRVSRDDPQFYLFKNWPQFSFKQKDYDTRQRSIGNVHGQSLYSLILKQQAYPEQIFGWPDTCCWSIVEDLKLNMESDASFARFLEKLVAFETGREFYSDPKVGCEWSQLIQQLLEVTFNKKLTAGPYKAPKRGNGFDSINFLSSSLPITPSSDEIDNLPPNVDEQEFEENNPQRGANTIIIETNQLERY
ncbi:hypothetical protein [Pseudoalteromonas sp. A757]|uniref:hypothetical protein n=1 Tax=Pseudoalteromonas sp. A757 TaxID=2250709 RepID=UPI000FFECC9A|nr:hypothetical protein [Pseudoalteromonas sp. A757]